MISGASSSNSTTRRAKPIFEYSIRNFKISPWVSSLEPKAKAKIVAMGKKGKAKGRRRDEDEEEDDDDDEEEEERRRNQRTRRSRRREDEDEDEDEESGRVGRKTRKSSRRGKEEREASPSPKRDLRRKRKESTVRARCLLFLINSISIVISSLMLFAGASASARIPSSSSPAVQPPFSAVIAVSAITLLNSVFGLAGACCAISRDGGWQVSCCSNRLLMAYYVIVLLMCSGLFYLMLLCFLFAAKAADFIEAYWISWSELFPQGQVSQEQVHSNVKKFSNLAGCLCLFTMLINVLSAHLSAVVMGYRYTTRRSILIINLVGFLIGRLTSLDEL
eukprot:756386-Hanusia_phi.AAC.1